MRRTWLLMLTLALSTTALAGRTDGATIAPDEAVRLAIAAAPSLDAQEASTAQARRDRDVATVDFVPTLDISATYTRLSDLDMPPFELGGMVIDSPFKPILDNYALKAQVTWPVSDLFLSIAPGYRAQRDAWRVQEAALLSERNTVAREALEAYYQLVRVRAGIGVAADGVAVLEAHAVRLDDLFAAGLVTNADVLATRAQLADARAQHAELVGLADVAEAHLAMLLDVDGPLAVDADPALPTDLPDDSLDALVEQALAQRPEVVMLDRLIDVHHHSMVAQRGAALPHLAVVGNLAYANPTQRVVPPTAEFFTVWDATVALTWSPGETAKRLNAAAKARTEETRARADRERLVRGVRVEVAQALARVAAAQRTVEAAGEQVRSADAAFAAQSDLLAAGNTTPADVLTAESTARRARHTLLNARVDLVVAEVQLDSALGTLVDEPVEGAR